VGRFHFRSSAFKHGFTKKDILNAIANPIGGAIHHSKRDVQMIIGFSSQGVPIEVLMTADIDNPVIFHCMEIQGRPKRKRR
jgi:orotate phosphoribosyltransferase-like protein